MEIWHVKPLENEDNLETVKKYINLLLFGRRIKMDDDGIKTPFGNFIRENPDMFYSPKRRSDNV